MKHEDVIRICLDGKELLVKKDVPLSINFFNLGISFINKSIRYYRPRGIVSLDTFCRNALVSVNDIPNVNPNCILCTNEMRVRCLRPKTPLFLSPLKSALVAGFQHKFLIRKPFVWKFC